MPLWRSRALRPATATSGARRPAWWISQLNRSRAVEAHLRRVEDALTGLPPHLQAEVDELLTVLGTTAGRLALSGLRSDWSQASPADISAALTAMRESGLAVRQQAYHALRNLTYAAYFGAPDTWVAIGYPGPRDI